MNKYKYDIILIFIIFITLIVLLFVLKPSSSRDFDDFRVLISVNGDEYGDYPLYENRIVEVHSEWGNNTVSVCGGSVCILEADCYNHLCMKMTIDNDNMSIVCLPNRLIVSVYSPKKAIYDSVAY